MMLDKSTLPIAIIGAGPIGLAAAANLADRGLTPLILESGPRIAASIWDWGHVQLFTPWTYLIDPVSERLLKTAGRWSPPRGRDIPTGKELVEQYLIPLAALDTIAPHIRLNHKVISVSKDGHDRMKDGLRDDAPFLLVAKTPEGIRRFRAKAVIDASGTWTTPNPLGAGGVLAEGEETHREHIRYGIPDVLDRERERYAGKRSLVVGSGHSAIGTVLSLVELAQEEENTQIAWAIRGTDPSKLWGGGAADELAERGALGTKVHEAVHSGAVALITGISIGAVRDHPSGLEVLDVDNRGQVVVDEIVVAAGSRPDLEMLRELRLNFDTATEATKALGPMIDPNHHSCGTVAPHGVEELGHPEARFFTAGMKSYGRAPTFLLRTGYEQVRSIVAELAGDYEAARRVELTLPKTAVCSTGLGNGAAGNGCC